LVVERKEEMREPKIDRAARQPLRVALLSELSRMAGQQVELVKRKVTGGAPVWLVVPVDRGQLRSGFWLAVQGSAAGGVWDAPERALAGFAAGVEGWVAASQAAAPGGALAGNQKQAVGLSLSNDHLCFTGTQ